MCWCLFIKIYYVLYTFYLYFIYTYIIYYILLRESAHNFN